MPKRPPATPSRRAANSPFAKLAENTASPSSTPPHGGAGKVGSPRTAPEPRDPHDAFLIPRTAEQTYHRRLRALLQDFLKEATAWEEEHTLEGIKWASDAKQTWEEISKYVSLLNPVCCGPPTQTHRLPATTSKYGPVSCRSCRISNRRVHSSRKCSIGLYVVLPRSPF